MGHTLGAAGILESIVTIHSMKENIIFPTFRIYNCRNGKKTHQYCKRIKGLQPCTNVLKKQPLVFGGCNAAIILEKA